MINLSVIRNESRDTTIIRRILIDETTIVDVVEDLGHSWVSYRKSYRGRDYPSGENYIVDITTIKVVESFDEIERRLNEFR